MVLWLVLKLNDYYMRQMNQLRLTGLLALSLITVNACSNSRSAENQDSNKSGNQETKEVQATNDPDASDARAEIDAAKENGNAAFVVVSDSDTPDADVEKALDIARGANSIHEKAEVIRLDRDNEANAPLVKEWQLNGVPMPLIVVMSSSGMVTGGQFLSQATAENVAAMVPSPKLESVYKAVGEGKHAIVAFTKESFSNRDAVLDECRKAVSKLDDEAVLIEVDMNDEKESSFMQQMRIDKNSADAPVTLVINKQGQLAGTAKSVPDAAKLVSAANTPVQGGCGPGCGPMGCDK